MRATVEPVGFLLSRRTLVRSLVLSLGLGLALAAGGPAWADSGQLRDPTRCGQGNANCRNLPPSASDRLRDRELKPAREKRQKVGDKPGIMRTSPLPSEGLQRNRDAPSSTGLDKGSTGISPPPRRRVSH
jgi:hypothetical protein